MSRAEPRDGREVRAVRSGVDGLVRLALTEWKLLLGAMVALFVASGGLLLYPRLLAAAVDRGSRSSGDFSPVFLQMCGLSLLLGGAVCLRQALFTVAGERIVKRLREQVYARLLDADIEFFHANQLGDLLNRLTVDVSAVRAAVTTQSGIVARNCVQILGGMVMLVWTSPLLGAVTLLLVSALGGLIVLSGRQSSALVRQGQAAFSNASVIAHEALSEIRTVRAFSADDYERTRYERALERAMHIARRAMWVGEGARGLVSGGSCATSAIVFWIGSHLVQDGRLTTGVLMSFLAYSILVALGLTGLGDVGMTVLQAAGASERVFELLECQPRSSSGSQMPETVHGAIELRGVQFSYRGRREHTALNIEHLFIDAGQSVALVGRSGAGKSTLAALLLRLYEPRHGKILLDGRDVRELDERWFRRQVAIVPQDPPLFSGSVAENIRYARPDASEAEIQAAAKAAGAHDFIAALPDAYRTQVGNCLLSGGERQRIAIARALLRKPKVLVLDEATGALDSENEHILRAVLEKMAGEVTVIIISHRLSTITHVDRIIVLEAGAVVQQGRHDELMRSTGLYRRLVELASRESREGAKRGAAAQVQGRALSAASVTE
jgi:ABC-type multidrug transport system fused ATPase/permease subunit